MEINLLTHNLVTCWDLPLFSGHQHIAEKFAIDDWNIETLEITTLNTTYTFIRGERDYYGLPVWYVLDGRAEVIGERVQMIGINSEKRSPKLIHIGDRLAICRIDNNYSIPLYTSPITQVALLYNHS